MFASLSDMLGDMPPPDVKSAMADDVRQRPGANLVGDPTRDVASW